MKAEIRQVSGEGTAAEWAEVERIVALFSTSSDDEDPVSE